MIKVVICDGDGTLLLPTPTPGVHQLVNSLPDLGMQLAIASNGQASDIKSRLEAAELPVPKIIVTRKDVGAAKPSPLFVKAVAEAAGVEYREMMFLGDDDKTDTFCAVNAGILPVTARYSKATKERQYGLGFNRPEGVLLFLRTYGCQVEPYFGWHLEYPYHIYPKYLEVKALLYNHTGLTDSLKAVLKRNVEVKVGSDQIPLRMLLFLYLVSQCYLSGLTSHVDWITFYPGHLRESRNATMDQYSTWLSKMFNERFEPNLLVRHTDAPQSHKMGDKRNIYDQLRTILVNPEHVGRIQGKTVLVLDDFTTRGNSLETARCMLLQAGAGRVIGVAMAKFGLHHNVAKIGKTWNACEPCPLTEKDVQVSSAKGFANEASDKFFQERIWSEFNK